MGFEFRILNGEFEMPRVIRIRSGENPVDRMREALRSLDGEIRFAEDHLQRCSKRFQEAARAVDEYIPRVLEGEATHKSTCSWAQARADDLMTAYNTLEELRDLKTSLLNLLGEE